MNIREHELKEISNINYYLYFLFNRKKLVYVGQTRNLSNRMVAHRRKEDSNSGTVQKKFDRYYAISSPCEQRTKRWEKILIKKLKPRYNLGHDKDARYRKIWVSKAWSKKKIENFKLYKSRRIDSDCRRKQGYYRLLRR